MEIRGKLEKAVAYIANRLIRVQENSTSRREFFTRIPGIASVTSALAAGPMISTAEASEAKGSPGAANKRAADSFQIRLDAAQQEAELPTPRQIVKWGRAEKSKSYGNYRKGLARNAIGEVAPAAHQVLFKAMRHGACNCIKEETAG